jgi:hypothetical protein
MRHPALAICVLSVLGAASFGQGVLYGVDIGADQLGTIDRNTAAWTVIGPNGAGINALTGLACDPVQNVLYALDPGTNSLFTVNQATGQGTLVGPTGFSNVNALAFDPVGNVLYGASLNGNSLFTIDVMTGAGTLIAPITGASNIEGLAFDPATATLYGIDDGLNKVVVISVTTAAATPLATTLPSTGLWRGLDWDSELGVIWASKVNTGQLFQVNPSTGAGTLIGSLPTFIQGLAFKPGLAPYQINQAGASLVIDGILGTPQSPALVNLLAGQPASVALSSANQGQPWEVVIGVAPLVPRGAGAISLPDGQVLNVLLSDPALTLLWNQFLSPPFSNAVLPVSFPFPGTLSIQMAVLDPTATTGVSLSQPIRVVVQ